MFDKSIKMLAEIGRPETVKLFAQHITISVKYMIRSTATDLDVMYQVTLAQDRVGQGVGQ